MRFFRYVSIVVGISLGLFLAYVAGAYGPSIYRTTVGLHHHETQAPVLPEGLGSPAILVFTKTNGFRHEEAIPAANALLTELATRHHWSVYITDNGAAFNTTQLQRFRAVVWNNTSGDVLNPGQRAAFKAWLEAGGGFIGIHAAGDDSHRGWPWYQDVVIKAHFIGHPMGPQFQQAMMHVEDATHPATKGLPTPWTHTEEWYSFADNPRDRGSHILVIVDENSYRPSIVLPFPLSLLKAEKSLRMGADHPVVWTHCVGKGRVFYSALGHRAEAYAEPAYRHLLDGALRWAIGETGDPCASPALPAPASDARNQGARDAQPPAPV